MTSSNHLNLRVKTTSGEYEDRAILDGSTFFISNPRNAGSATRPGVQGRVGRPLA